MATEVQDGENRLRDVLQRVNTFHSASYSQLRPKQAETLEACYHHDVVCVLPTGSGKTLIMEALPFLQEKYNCIVIANGLNAIIEEQQIRFGNSCITVNGEVVKVLEKKHKCDSDDNDDNDEDKTDEDGESEHTRIQTPNTQDNAAKV